MKCQQCGREAGEECLCTECREQNGSIQVLTPQERETFTGVTLEQDEGEAHREQTAGGVNVRYVSFSSTKSGFLTKLVFMAIFLLFVFIALPLALLVMGAVLLYWLLFKRR